MEEKSKKLCTECGENPALVRTDGQVIHGLCSSCIGARISQVIHGLCSSCIGARISQGRHKKKGESENVATPKKTKTLNLDLSRYPDAIKGLEDSSIVHIRTVELQAIAYIVQGLQNDGYGKPAEDKA